MASAREVYGEIWARWDYPSTFPNADTTLLCRHPDSKPVVSGFGLGLKDPEKKVSWVPFKYSKNEGFVIRREDKMEMLACGDHIIRETHDPIFRRPYWFNRKYIVWVGHKGCEHKFVGFDNPLIAINFAYSKFRHNQLTLRILKQLDCVGFKETISYKILRPAFELKPDVEYNNLVKSTEGPTPTLKPSVRSTDFPTGNDTVPSIYESFKTYMDNSLASKTRPASQWGSKSNCVGTLECLAGEQLLLRTSKRNVPFDYVTECVKHNGFSPLVTRFPKTGVVTSDGFLREIFPMNILYENVLRRFLGDCKPQVPYELAKGRDFGLPRLHFYDVKGCDRQVNKYLARYCKERGLEFLIPLVHDPLHDPQKAYYTDKFPSGVLHTSLVTVCYTAALCDYFGCFDAVIQGDGFMSDEVVIDPLIREESSFNGFQYCALSKFWHYTRGDRLYEYKYLRGAGPQGNMRYLINRWAYENLGYVYDEHSPITCERGLLNNHCTAQLCVQCNTYTYRGLHFWEMGDWPKCQLINALYSDVGNVVMIVMREKGAEFDTRKNNWDSQKLTEIKVDWKIQPKSLMFPRIADPN